MICRCGKPASQMHHRFPQTKVNKRLYGELIHDQRNLEPMCANCHVSHAKVSVWRERDFCRALGIEVRSKTERARLLREIK
jgi:hypothetical protein